jgi:hypothetical protein
MKIVVIRVQPSGSTTVRVFVGLAGRFVEVTGQDELDYAMIGARTQSEAQAGFDGERRAAIVDHRKELVGLHIMAVEVLQRSEVVAFLGSNCPSLGRVPGESRLGREIELSDSFIAVVDYGVDDEVK